MHFCCSAGGDGSKVHLRLLGCSAFVAAWLCLAFIWLRYACLGVSHPFQVQALQTCPGQTNRTQFLNSVASGYQCYGPSEPTEAVIVSVYEGLQSRQVAALRNNRAAYSERHGYRYCEFNSRPDPTRGASWNKIAASLLVVHCSQYVLALDSDAVIVNYDLGIRDIFQDHGNGKDILFSKDYGGNSIINAGSMLIKRSKWSVWFLQHLYNEHRVWQQGGQKGQEQGAINQFAVEHSFHFSQHTGIVPYEVFNNHRLRYESGTFVAHYAGWGSSRERYERIADELDDPNAIWSEFSQDSVAANNATRQFCTEALTIQAPHERMTDRFIRSLSTGKGILLLLSRLWVPSSRLGGIPQWPMTAALNNEDFGDALCHQSWNMTVSY